MATENLKIKLLFEQIMKLTITEQRELLALLRDEGGPDIGVREPRRPLAPTSSGAVALEQDDPDEDWPMPPLEHCGV